MRKLSIILFLIGLSLLFIKKAESQNIHRLTVKESVKMGLEHNFGLRIAEADADEAEAAYRQARTGRLPVIRGQASYMRLSDNIPEVDFSLPGSDTTFTILPVELDRFHSEVSIQQLLFAGGRLDNQIEAAAHRADASKLMEDQEKANVAFEIRQAYWNLYRTLAVNEATKTALAHIEEHLQNVRNQVEEGTALRTDLLNAETRRSEIHLDQIESSNRVRVARLELNRLIGISPEEETEPATPEQPGDLPFRMDELVDRALNLRPELDAVSKQIDAHEAEIGAKKGEWFPEISLMGRYVYARPNQYFFAQQDEFRGTWEAGVQLRWNLWTGGQKIAETSRIKARLRGAEAQQAQMREQIIVEVSRRYLELERSSQAIDAAAQSVESAEEAFRSIQIQFKEGTALSEQVLDAEQAHRQAIARHAEAIADYEIAYASVLNALGQIWED